MNFEEAIKELRKGAKIRHPHMEKDEYLMGCYYHLNNELFGIPPENFESVKSLGMSVVKMKGNEMHPDMRPQLPFLEQMHLLEKYPFLRDKITYPTINLLFIMSEDWEIVNEADML